MKIKYVFIMVATLLLTVSLWWGISRNSILEPWTAVLSAILALLGIFYPSANESKPLKTNISQGGFFAFFNSNTAKKIAGKIRQWNIFGIGNVNKIED